MTNAACLDWTDYGRWWNLGRGNPDWPATVVPTPRGHPDRQLCWRDVDASADMANSQARLIDRFAAQGSPGNWEPSTREHSLATCLTPVARQPGVSDEDRQPAEREGQKKKLRVLQTCGHSAHLG